MKKHTARKKNYKKKKRKTWLTFEAFSLFFVLISFILFLCARIAGSHFNYKLAIQAQTLKIQVEEAKEKVRALQNEVNELLQYERIMDICKDDDIKYIQENIYILEE